MGKHKIWCYSWHFWLKGLQIATVGLADGFPSGTGMRMAPRSAQRKASIRRFSSADPGPEPTLETRRRQIGLSSLRSLHCNSQSCSQAATNLRERDEPRNTRKANREEVCFPRVLRVPRLVLPAFGWGFAALGSLHSLRLPAAAERDLGRVTPPATAVTRFVDLYRLK